MSVDVVAQYTHKSASAAWLSRHWLAWSDEQLLLESMFGTLGDARERLSDFENRCAQALGTLSDKTNPGYHTVSFDLNGNLTYRPTVVHDAVLAKLASQRAEANYTATGTSLNRDHEVAYGVRAQLVARHRTLKQHTSRFSTLFGLESPEGTYSSYLDEARESDRERWLDASFVEREMPGHDRFVCPVCATVAKDGQVGASSINATGYVNPCCQNFDCPNYGERLMTLARFREWLAQGAVDDLSLTRAEYQAEYGWDARGERAAHQETNRWFNTRRTPLMREIVRYATTVREGSKRTHPGTQTPAPQCAAWQLIGPRLPKQGDIVSTTRAYVEVSGAYWQQPSGCTSGKVRRTRLVHHDMHRNVGRGREARGMGDRREWQTPERWGEAEEQHLNNPHAIGVRSSGSFVVASH